MRRRSRAGIVVVERMVFLPKPGTSKASVAGSPGNAYGRVRLQARGNRRTRDAAIAR
jgi:hypothetical protein